MSPQRQAIRARFGTTAQPGSSAGKPFRYLHLAMRFRILVTSRGVIDRARGGGEGGDGLSFSLCHSFLLCALPAKGYFKADFRSEAFFASFVAFDARCVVALFPQFYFARRFYSTF